MTTKLSIKLSTNFWLLFIILLIITDINSSHSERKQRPRTAPVRRPDTPIPAFELMYGAKFDDDTDTTLTPDSAIDTSVVQSGVTRSVYRPSTPAPAYPKAKDDRFRDIVAEAAAYEKAKQQGKKGRDSTIRISVEELNIGDMSEPILNYSANKYLAIITPEDQRTYRLLDSKYNTGLSSDKIAEDHVYVTEREFIVGDFLKVQDATRPTRLSYAGTLLHFINAAN